MRVITIFIACPLLLVMVLAPPLAMLAHAGAKTDNSLGKGGRLFGGNFAIDATDGKVVARTSFTASSISTSKLKKTPASPVLVESRTSSAGLRAVRDR